MKWGNIEASGLLAHLPTVKYIAKSFPLLPNSLDSDDLILEGLMADMDTQSKYDHSKGCPLPRYRYHHIKFAMLDAIRRSADIPRSLKERAKRLQAARDTLTDRLSREPDEFELALELKMDIRKFRVWSKPLSSAISSEWLHLRGLEMQKDNLLDAMIRDEWDARLMSAINSLTEKQRMVIQLLFYQEAKVTDVAKLMSISPGGVCNIRTRALNSLKKVLDEKK